MARHQAAAHLAQAVLPQNLKANLQLGQASPLAVVTMDQLTRLVTITPTIVANSVTTTMAQPSFNSYAGSIGNSLRITDVTCVNGNETDDSKDLSKEEPTTNTTNNLIVDSYKTASPILVSPGKLDALATTTGNKQRDWVSRNVADIG